MRLNTIVYIFLLLCLIVITHMCRHKSVLWRTGVEGYRRQNTMVTLPEQGRS